MSNEQKPKRKYNVKKTSSKWLHSDEFSHIIIDKPHGWDDNDPNKFVSEKITRDEFIRRLEQSDYHKKDE